MLHFSVFKHMTEKLLFSEDFNVNGCKRANLLGVVILLYMQLYIERMLKLIL